MEDFVKNINKHRDKFYLACAVLCVDELMLRWYGLGMHWINIGLPMYIALDHKPDNGCEIQNCCNGRSGIMIKLRLVKFERKQTEILKAAQEGNG